MCEREREGGGGERERETDRQSDRETETDAGQKKVRDPRSPVVLTIWPCRSNLFVRTSVTFEIKKIPV